MSDVGLSDVGLLWKWVSAAFGNVLDQAGHKSSTPPSLTTPPRALKKIYTGKEAGFAFGSPGRMLRIREVK